MENPVEKKRFPWGWVAAGCGLAVFCVLAVAAAALIAAITVPGVRTVIVNQGQPSIQLPTPLAPTSAPNSGPGSDTGIGSLPFKFSAIQGPAGLSNQSLMDRMVSSLNLNSDTDFMAPKSYKDTATLDLGSSFTLGNGWCAKDTATLRQNLTIIQYQFSINGTPIDLSKYPTLTFTDNQGHACALTGISITPDGNLSEGYHMVLTQKFLNSLNDGITSSPYPSGDVTFDFTIQFRSTSNSGSNS
ncbi:MAG: hypothetical protein ACM3PY_03285 [Omnitrophica WOR_2 bacterium]